MEKELINTQNLSDFVSVHNLKNRYSNIDFYALVSIDTINKKIIDVSARVMISFGGYDNYGSIEIIADELECSIYPTSFNAKWQKMEHIDDVYLKIIGEHTKNPEIGKYTVKIVPTGELVK